MKIRLLVGLTALALGLASIGGIAPTIGDAVGGHGGNTLAGGNAGANGGEVYTLAGGNAGASGGDIHA